MDFLKKLFSKRKKIQDDIEADDVHNKTEENVDNRSKILFHIQDILSKLELINFSHGKTNYLTEKINFYYDQLNKIEDDYRQLHSTEQNSTDISLQNYDTNLQYLLSLSTLSDELDTFSQTYFYLEDLDVLKKSFVNRTNFTEQLEKLLKLENIIQSYHDSNEDLDNHLHNSLIDVIFTFLKKEVVFEQECCLYNKISSISKLMVQKRYLEELVQQAENNPYIQEYLNNNDIETLSFDYSILSKLESKEVSLQEMDDLHTSSALDLDDDEIEKMIEKFEEKVDDAICANCFLSLTLGDSTLKDVNFRIVERSKKLDYNISSFQVIHNSKKKDNYYYFVVSDGESRKSAVIVGLLWIDFRKKISSYQQKLYLMDLKKEEVSEILSLVNNDLTLSSVNKLFINQVFSILYDYNYDIYKDDDLNCINKK